MTQKRAIYTRRPYCDITIEDWLEMVNDSDFQKGTDSKKGYETVT